MSTHRRATPSAPDSAPTPDLGAPEGPATAAGAGRGDEGVIVRAARFATTMPEFRTLYPALAKLEAALAESAAPPAAGSREATPDEH